MTGSADDGREARQRLRRAQRGALIGTMLEGYDFGVYGLASALAFPAVFFPNASPATGVLASFGAYATGFVARPVGGLFFSRFGDRYGRKWVLVATLMLMGTATFAIGLLPGYAQIGIAAPALLVVLRFLQGFGAGAEQSGGATLLTESAPPGRRGRSAAAVMAGGSLGVALSSGVWLAAQSISRDALLSWGWRLVFLASIAVTALAFVLRRKLRESTVFEEIAHGTASAPVLETMRTGKRSVLLATAMCIGPMSHSYVYLVFFPSFLIQQVHMSPKLVPALLLIGPLFGFFAAFLAGRLSDRWGRRRVYTFILVGSLVMSAPAFLLATLGQAVLIAVISIFSALFPVVGAPAVQASYLPELFGSRYRYAGCTISREIGSLLGGGFAPLICSFLVGVFAGSWIPVAAYMMLIMLISILATRLAPETADRDLHLPHDAFGAVRSEKGTVLAAD
ncbi:MFS transporter [Amycolatopsis jejuensis]|uniref:MFS transporter n=1 Tax=Amycolatopsis jejuensis TaxID=330084 RepID=UPI00068A0DFA|nr:MFS transporter [Amycolatopsis jejuensis]